MMNYNLPANQLDWREYSYSLQQDGNKISFDFSIKYEYHSGKKLIKITRNTLLTNNISPDETLIGNLVFQASEALFPLVLQINSFGYPTGINNHSEILERWKSYIPKLQAYYDNPLSIKLLNRIGKLYRNPEKLLAGLQNDWFLSAFFFPVYGEYRDNEAIELQYHFPSVVGKTAYKTELFFNHEKTDNGKTEISLFGHSSFNENNKVNGKFLLNADRSIYEIRLELLFDDNRQNTVVLIQETKEIVGRKTAVNVVFDEKEEREKLINNKSFFIEEIIDSSILPKHK